MDIDQTLLDFVSLHTKTFDTSHDIHHAISVYKNAIYIAQQDFPLADNKVLMYACLLHDVCDHKYDLSISKEQRNKFIEEQLQNEEQSKCVIDVIDNISYSQEVKGLRKTLSYPSCMYQHIVSDADKLEALGQVGLDRCIAFTKARGGKVPDDVIEHCHEKLLKLKDSFIRTRRGKELAEPLHNIILEYCLYNC